LIRTDLGTTADARNLDWAVAAAAGLNRTPPKRVGLKTGGDGYEQTGWDLVYLHMATKDRRRDMVNRNDHNRASVCEGGMHPNPSALREKYKANGWADGPIPFVLTVGQCTPGTAPYPAP